MSFQVPKEEYNGKINTVKIGNDSSEISIGGEAVLPFYNFEGEMPNKPIVAMDVYDEMPENFPEYFDNKVINSLYEK